LCMFLNCHGSSLLVLLLTAGRSGTDGSCTCNHKRRFIRSSDFTKSAPQCLIYKPLDNLPSKRRAQAVDFAWHARTLQSGLALCSPIFCTLGFLRLGVCVCGCVAPVRRSGVGFRTERWERQMERLGHVMSQLHSFDHEIDAMCVLPRSLDFDIRAL
jgi:hypothetical protein